MTTHHKGELRGRDLRLSKRKNKTSKRSKKKEGSKESEGDRKEMKGREVRGG